MKLICSEILLAVFTAWHLPTRMKSCVAKILTGDMLDDDGNLEYAGRIDETNGDGEFLSEAALLVKGCGSLEYFCDMIKKRPGKD